MHPLQTYLLRFVPSLAEADWQALAPALRPCHLARGAHFVQAGERRPELALLLHGSCRLYYVRPDGEEPQLLLLRTLPAGRLRRLTDWPAQPAYYSGPNGY